MNLRRRLHGLPISFITLLVFFGALIFSYYPLLQFGEVEGIHLDISFLYLLAFLTVIFSISLIWKQRGAIWKSFAFRILVFYTIYLSLSAGWSPNPLRAAFTAGFTWLVLLIVSTVLVQARLLSKHAPLIRTILGWSFTVLALFATWQLLAEAWGVPSHITLLPTDYQSAVFGVARPTGFALEPQFFASLLLIPYSWSLYEQLRRRGFDRTSLVLFISTTLLILSLSRGALGAALLATFILLVTSKASWKNYARTGVVLTLSLVVAMVSVFSLAAINQRDSISGTQALSRTINHLSFDIATLPKTETQPKLSKQSSPSTSPRSSSSSGYVESSTSSRLVMAKSAISIWTRDLETILFGVGIGGFGATIHALDPSYATSSVVNNYYLETLVETGIVGFGLFISFLVYLAYQLLRRRLWLPLALLAAFALQWYFFSGNANILHIWAYTAIALVLTIFPPWKSPMT